MKAELSRCNKLIDDGFSLIAVGENKVPFGPWKENQTKAFTKDEFLKQYNNPKAGGTGLVTGYQNLEVIDIDLKVLPTVLEQKTFWDDYLQFLKDSIFDFESKFVIVKTRNAGFHILYKCSYIEGSKKIATQKNSEALIESRGDRGYVFIYNNFIQGKDYTDIQEITVEDRKILWDISKYYSYVEDVPEPKLKEIKHYEIGVTSWDDYNNKTRVWDLISSEFTIVRQMKDMTIIRRNGAKSPHSGYIYSNNRMYLFSTGTRYESNKLYSPFLIYAVQYHGGIIENAYKQLLKNGYGTRFKPDDQPKSAIKPELLPVKENTATFPIDVFPEEIQYYFSELNQTLSAATDYLGCSFLWALSLCIGNSVKIEIKRGWIEAASVWIALVGKTGVGKTPSIKTVISPLQLRNSIEAKLYQNEREKYEEYLKDDSKKKGQHEKVKEPKRKTFIHDDVTIESLLECHASNLNAIGIFRDELSGWIKDMNKYRAGSDLETWLSCWSNTAMSQSRKTAKSYYISNGFIPVLGGIQPSILTSHFTPENKENGFVDRILLCFPELEVEYFNENEISCSLLKWYDDYIVGLYDLVRRDFFQIDEYDRVSSKIVRFSPESKAEWIRIHKKITDMQRSDEVSEYMKSFLPKQKSYVARFALLLNILNNYNHGDPFDEITMKSILGAERLSDYFTAMAKKVKIDSMESKGINDMVKNCSKVTPRDQFEAIYSLDKNINRTKVADQFGVSRNTILRWIKEMV
jgi:hypothetical protein